MFISPVFLIAAAVGAAIPLILHLMQNRRREKITFPTLRFLREAQKQSSRRIRMENLLLWLIRTLIMILLGLAFAMPILRSRGFGWLGNAPRDVAIVIDASYSMEYNAGRETVWERTLETATAMIEALEDNDRVCLFLAREVPEALIAEPISDHEKAINRLKDLAPGTGSSQLAPAVTEAVKALQKDDRRREREVHVLTDNQALPWLGFHSGGEAGEEPATVVVSDWDPGIFDQRTTLFVALLGVPAPENLGPDSIDLQPSLVRVGSAARVTAGIQRSGETAESTATLFVDDEQVARLPLRLDAAEGSIPDFSLPPLPPGVHSARIETPDDNLPIDNQFHFLVRVEDQLPALCVGSPDDTLFVRTALRAGAGSDSFIAESVAPDEVAGRPLAGYSCIILCNALPVSGQTVTALEDYVSKGGLLVVFPGLKANPEAYRAWTCLPGTPAGFEETPWSRRRRTLSWDKPTHTLVRPLRESLSVPALTVRRRLTFGDLHENAERLISMGAEQPFLLDRPFGDGRVLLFAVSADRTWSDFPLSPFYLPIILQCLDYSAGFGARTPFLWAEDSISLSEVLPEVAAGATLLGPDHQPVPVRSTDVKGRKVTIAENLTKPGIYRVSARNSARPSPALAINLRRHESNLAPLTRDEVAERVGVENLNVATDRESLEQLITEHRVGRTYGEHLLWLAFILIGVEFFYANALLKTGPRLSKQLRVDASGKVKGQASAAEAATAS